MPQVTRWSDIDWRRTVRNVRKLQRRQSRAAEARDWRLVRRLRHLLFASRDARLLAVRRVTQENRGRSTPGVDGWASLSDKEKLALAQTLDQDGYGQPYRYVAIPKPNGGNRELRIPTIRDRALQALLKLCLEPEFNVTLDPHLYGGLPGAGAYDAVRAIVDYLQDGPKYVAVADIQDFFPSTKWNQVEQALHLSRNHQDLVDTWLQAPTVKAGALHFVDRGLPQGTVIAPLIAHATLGGLHEYALAQMPEEDRPLLVVYVDDVRVLAKTKVDAALVLARAKEWLEAGGYKLNPEKTSLLSGPPIRSTEALIPGGEGGGFEFLGARFVQYPASIAKESARSVEINGAEPEKPTWMTYVVIQPKNDSGYGGLDPRVLKRRLDNQAFVRVSDEDWY